MIGYRYDNVLSVCPFVCAAVRFVAEQNNLGAYSESIWTSE